MRIHVIDTRRTQAWRDAFGVRAEMELRFAHEYNAELPIEINQDDIVFAHAHEDTSGDHPDFPVTDWERPYLHSEKIQGFVTFLRQLEHSKVPFVVLYSGGDINETTGNQWVTWTIAQRGPLESYPEERVKFYKGVVAPASTGDSLRTFVEGVIGTLAPQVRPSASLDIAWIEETKLAAQLLLEADKLKTDNCNGIKIAKPSAELVQLAKQVINPSGEGPNLVAAAEVLCTKLASLKG